MTYTQAPKRRQVPQRLKEAAILALIFIAYGIVGHFDYEDEVAMEAARKASTTVASASK